jgi:hypothetical protein
VSSFLYKWSRPFDVGRVSDHPSVQNAINSLLDEVLAQRDGPGRRIRDKDKIRKHLVAIILDLYVASIEKPLGLVRPCPRWIGTPLSKAAFRHGSRYKQLHLSYRHFTSVLADLVGLGYVKQRIGFYDRRQGGKAYVTRIRARSKLLSFLRDQAVVPEMIERERQQDPEVIVLRDRKKKPVEYEDTEQTITWRENLRAINRSLSALHLGLLGVDVGELNRRLLRDPEHRPVEFDQNQLKRVFNNSSFEEGGRFYGGWWQNIPREYRKHIAINHSLTAEVDYSGYHVRMLYSDAGLDAPDDPYDIPGLDRDVQKLAMQILINAEARGSASSALARKGIRPKQVLPMLQERHAPIAGAFHSGMGTKLQFRDSCVAERIMLAMLGQGIPVLPVHDSFIVPQVEEEELETQMELAFLEEFPGQRPMMKSKEVLLRIKPEVWKPGSPLKGGQYVRAKDWRAALEQEQDPEE